jgi:8-oxo-dGTP pyrophosphatase MutT (NUDIX family)
MPHEFHESRRLLPEGPPLPEKEAFLEDMRAAVLGNEQGEPFPGYPELAGRLHIPPEDMQYTSDDRPIFPIEPGALYVLPGHPDKRGVPRPADAFYDTGGPLPPEEAEKIIWADMSRDGRGFPVHRYAVDMATDPKIGVGVGLGYYYHPGKIETVDLGVLGRGVPAETGPDEHGLTPAIEPGEDLGEGTHLGLLVVLRGDTGQVALPGGHVDRNEPYEAAALRELGEETHVERTAATSLGTRVVADPRLTTSTEVETTLFVVDDGRIPAERPVGDDDATHADYVITNRDLLAPQRTFGAHRRMIEEAVGWYQNRHGVTVMDDGRIIPNSELETQGDADT